MGPAANAGDVLIGAGLGEPDYTVTRLNQYSNRTVPGVDVVGVATPAANVTVNGNAAYRKGEYLWHLLSVTNSSKPACPTVTLSSTDGAGQSQSGKVYVPAMTEPNLHDIYGDLTDDGRWHYTLDGENRLTEMIRDTNTPSAPRQKLAVEYDLPREIASRRSPTTSTLRGMGTGSTGYRARRSSHGTAHGRRIRKQHSTCSGGWAEQPDLIFLYDGWNLEAEPNRNANKAPVRLYMWGADMRGTPSGAGGIGGLLLVEDYSTWTYSFMLDDGIGNVGALVHTRTGALQARYDYGPFGELIRATGPAASVNPIRFFTKFTDFESGLVHYGYRYLNTTTGGWVSRDPIGQSAGLNVYIFCRNAPIAAYDRLGLRPQLKAGTVLSEADGDDFLVGVVGTHFTPDQKTRAAKALCEECRTHQPTWWIKDQAEKFARECDVNLAGK